MALSAGTLRIDPTADPTAGGDRISIAGAGSITYLGDPEVSRRITGPGEIRGA